MSWIFLPGGLLMPAETPMDLAPHSYTQGIRNLQVRARAKSHLENFINEYMEPLGLDYSDIQATPGMDYNFRFYTRRGEFAQAIAASIIDIDYEKFKPEAERKDAAGKPLYAEGKEYHSVLNSIWGTVTRLGSPGGAWGSYSGGYGSTSRTVGGKYGGSYTPPKASTPAYTPAKNKPTAAALAAAGVTAPDALPTKDVPKLVKPIAPPKEVKNLNKPKPMFKEPTVEEEDSQEENFNVDIYDPKTGKTSSKSIHDMTDEEWALMEADENSGKLDKLFDAIEADEESPTLTEPSPGFWDDDDTEPTSPSEDRPFGYRTAQAIRLMAEKIPYENWEDVMDQEEIDYLLETQTTFNEATGEIELTDKA